MDQEGSLSGVSVVATDCPSLAVKASAFGVPVWFYHEYGGEMLECGPFSEGSQILQKPASSEELLQALAAKVLAAEEARVEGATLRRVEQGPLILWPGEDLTEEAFWDFLFRYSTWSLHLRGAEVSFASLVSRFSAFLLRCELKIHQRFFLHAHLQNLNHVQEQLESLLGQSRGSLSEIELFAWVRRTPFPSARAAAWFELKNDLQSSQPKVSLFYQVRLFLTHMRVQRQLLTHCLAILEGENERIFSE